ncbi:MAG: hypothetical protein NVV74_22395 [Magnetospirillum sp.]|nr:hypothetical protein [Magnetospirillum sp.]
MQGIKAIKALVAFMGFLLLAGLALLVYGLMTTSKSGGKPRPAASVSAPVAEFGAVAIPVPAGSRVEQTLVVGERVVLRLAGGGADRLLVLDPAEGKVMGSFVLAPEAPAGR